MRYCRRFWQVQPTADVVVCYGNVKEVVLAGKVRRWQVVIYFVLKFPKEVEG